MKILFATSECNPFLKTGGLGDVSYALPKALRKIGVDVRVIMPKYEWIPQHFKNNMKHIASFDVPLGWRSQFGGLEYLEYDSIPFYFIDNEYYFKRPGAYGYFDDGERFAYFSRAILQAVTYMNDFNPDIIHCNDWQTAILPVLLKEHYRDFDNYNHIKTVLTIHNLRFQGVFDKSVLTELLNLDDSYYSEDKLKFYDKVSFLKGGIKFCDKISTVSNTYSEEIKTPFFGEKLDGLLQSRDWDLWGIVNGIDYDIQNPATDENIFVNYDVNSIDKKVENKLKLQEMLHLPVNKDIPLIGIVSRLTEQKGLDLIACILEALLNSGLQVVVLGTGEKEYEDMFKHFQWKYPDNLSSNILFDNSLAQKIYAGSDIFLMPSLFEPCGIGQLIALRYGSIPIVRETGGLKDTVTPYNEFTGEGNGFSFANYNFSDMEYVINMALYYYRDKDKWNNLIKNAMNSNNSWDKSAYLYRDMYSQLN